MNQVAAAQIKLRATELGMDLCGIAPVGSFADAPQGFHPADISKDCKSVIVLAARFPVSTLSSPSPAAYTFVRNKVMDKVDAATCQLAVELELLGSNAVPIPSSDPYEYWDEARRHGQGILSLKHAAVRAGLGQMGKNTLLINDRLGNMLWLGAVLLNQELTPDEQAGYQACITGCRVCLQACPAQALDGSTIVQKQCRAVSYKQTGGGGGVYTCNLCRRLCPRHDGIK
ncbi:hypothetical protein [Anaerospora sp.]|uniref:hypothetical protein n=1 Tax=Anaerospora sp. TaxID=1960278 RepID=UPI00289D5B79|nr:hypothetical protein [Anaerospora sp.]